MIFSWKLISILQPASQSLLGPVTPYIPRINYYYKGAYSIYCFLKVSFLFSTWLLDYFSFALFSITHYRYHI